MVRLHRPVEIPPVDLEHQFVVEPEVVQDHRSRQVLAVPDAELHLGEQPASPALTDERGLPAHGRRTTPRRADERPRPAGRRRVGTRRGPGTREPGRRSRRPCRPPAAGPRSAPRRAGIRARRRRRRLLPRPPPPAPPRSSRTPRRTSPPTRRGGRREEGPAETGATQDGAPCAERACRACAIVSKSLPGRSARQFTASGPRPTTVMRGRPGPTTKSASAGAWPRRWLPGAGELATGFKTSECSGTNGVNTWAKLCTHTP